MVNPSLSLAFTSAIYGPFQAGNLMVLTVAGLYGNELYPCHGARC